MGTEQRLTILLKHTPDNYQETQAPKGYKLDDRLYPFEINADGAVTKCDLPNYELAEEEKNAYTDVDASMTLLYISFISAAIAGILMIRKRKES